MKLGLIGCGNMGEALLNGVLQAGVFRKEDVLIYDTDGKKSGKLREKWGVSSAKDEKDAAANADMIVIAVKPQDMPGLMRDIGQAVNTGRKILVSIAAGIPVSFYRKTVSENPVVRVMPNILMLIGKGASGIFMDGDMTEQEKSAVLSVFRASGTAEIVKKEEWLDAVTGLSGSGPAYVFTFINSLADGGVKEGLPRELSLKLAVQTVLGSALLAESELEQGTHLEKLKDNVTSPGGTTAAGIYALEKGRFRYTVISAVRDAAQRARKLGGK